MAEFDRLAQASGLFGPIYPEVRGAIIHPRLKSGEGAVRIDRILMPGPKLMAAGWEHGPIGVEGKCPGEKMGKALVQATDYTRSTFELKPGFHIMLEWVYLWPFRGAYGDLASTMAQNRVGTVHTSPYYSLLFQAAHQHMIEVRKDGAYSVKNSPMGCKRGAR
jgi:hypothetical protein